MNWPMVIVAILGWLVCWGAWVSLWVMKFNGSALTRDEHAKICGEKDEELNRRFDKLEVAIDQKLVDVKATLEKQDNVSKETRHQQNGALHEISLKLERLATMVDAAAVPRARPRR